MKKLLSIIVALVIVITMFAGLNINLTVNAVNYGYLTYEVSNSEVVLTECNASVSGALEIPSTISGYPVTRISDFAFRYCRNLTSIIIPECVTIIGEGAFADCSSLTSITIPNNVASIGNYAFYNCSGLTSITIPNGVTNIGNHTFYACSSLISITIPDSVTSIGNYAFFSCSSLTNIIIPDGVTSIGESVFNGCSSLRNITIPNSVTGISSYAFPYCRSLTSITIPDSVTSIGRSAFYGCSRLTTVYYTGTKEQWDNIWINSNNENLTIATRYYNSCIQSAYHTYDYDCDAVCNICGLTRTQSDHVYDNDGDAICNSCNEERFVFYYTISSGETTVTGTNIEPVGELVIPSTFDGYPVTSIGDSAFENCSCLTSVTIPNGVTSIGSSAFYNCSGITNVTIPKSVTSIGRYAFLGCSSLTDVYYKGSYSERTENINMTSAGVALSFAIWHYDASLSYIYNDTNCTAEIEKCEPCGPTITIPREIIKDGKNYLVTAIRDYAFDECNALKDVYYEGSYRNRIEDLSINFYLNTNLSSTFVTWHYDVEENLAFTYDDTNLTAMVSSCHKSATMETIPSTIVKNGKTYTVVGIESDAFRSCGSLKKIIIPNSITSIGDAAFLNCDSLESLNIPDSVTQIGTHSFGNCNGLISVYIPDSVIVIEDTAFSGCSELTSVTIGEGVQEIGGYAFSSCPKLETVNFNARYCYTMGNGAMRVFTSCDNLKIANFGDSVKIIPSHIFEDCTSLTTVNIGKNVKEIRSGAFEGCSGITGITIPDSVNTIESWTFYGCSNLSSVTLGNGLSRINSYTFKGCGSLTNVVIPEGVTNIYASAFEECRNLESITIPKSLTNIGEYAFFNCESLTDVWYNGTEYERNNISFSIDSNSPLKFAEWHCKITLGDIDGVEGVSDRDAVYLLYHTFLPGSYPVNQNCDFNKDNEVNDKDAIYLLYHTFLPDSYPIS